MSAWPADLAPLVPRLPVWASAPGLRVTPLPGGWTNENYRIDGPEGAFALRVSGEHARALGVDRESEAAIARRAAHAGLAPELIGFLLPEGHMLTRFVAGRTFPWDRAPAREDALRMLEVVRAVHALPPVDAGYSAFDIVEGYWAATRAAGGALPEDVPRLARRVAEIRRGQTARPERRCFCHNDLSLGNFVASEGGRLFLLDWEYAAMGDPFFDLATLIVGHRHDAATERLLLERYTGGPSDGDRRRLGEMELLYELREASWAGLLLTLSGGTGPLAPKLRSARDDFYAAARARLERG